MKRRNDTTETWEALRGELQALRGRNLFRGNEVQLFHKNQLWLYKENRAGKMESAFCVVHVTPSPHDLWSEWKPEGKISKAADEGGDWKLWLQSIIAACRGEAYLRTNSKSAEYRKVHVTETNPATK